MMSEGCLQIIFSYSVFSSKFTKDGLYHEYIAHQVIFEQIAKAAKTTSFSV